MIIYNAKVITMEDKEYENGFVEVQGRKIVRVGDMMQLQDTFGGIDAGGATLLPGFIDAHCHLGVYEDGIGFEGDDGNEESDPTTPHLRALDAINPMDRCFTEALDAGVTTVMTGMGSANPIGGQWVAMKTHGMRVDNMVFRAPSAMKFALGENPKTVYHDKNLSPNTRMATAAIIREQLFKASRYLDDYQKAEQDPEYDKPEFDAKCEALLPVLQGKLKVHFHCHRSDDIFTAIRIAREFSLDYVLIHATEGYIIADELAADGANAVIGPIICDRSKPELRNLSISSGAQLHQNGITFAICTDHPVSPIQYLPVSAALCVRGGLAWKEALRAITINAARVCGLDDCVGSIKAGKDADLLLFDGDALDIQSMPRLVIVNGEIVRGNR